MPNIVEPSDRTVHALGSPRKGVLARAWLGVALLSAVISGTAGVVEAGVARTGVHDYYHIQKGEREYKSVVRLDLQGSGGDGICSGVLISPRIILTAGHCVVSPGVGTLTGATIRTGGETYTAQKWAIHPKWNGTNLTDGTDLAMIRLDKPIRSITPSTYALAGDEQDKKASSAGYGAGGNGTDGFFTPAGTKRVGENIIDFIEGPKKRVLLYDFDGPGQVITNPKKDYPLALEYMAAPGDSGGGLFIGSTLVGITSFIIALEDGAADATFRDYAGYTRVQKHWRWIRKTQRALLRNRPGSFGTPSNPLGEGDIASGFQQTWKGAPLIPALYMHGASAGVGAVPEPGSALLLGLGAVALLRRRRTLGQ